MDRDAVDDLIDQWRVQRPDIDPAHLDSAGIVNRLGRLYGYAAAVLDAEVGGHGLKIGEFDVLSSLRRQGPPYEATPGVMIRDLFLSSGAMTNRVDRLEQAGLVERRPDPNDGRGVIVRLTRAGLRTIDRAIETHTAAEHDLLAVLDDRERRQLDRVTRKLLASVVARRAR